MRLIEASTPQAVRDGVVQAMRELLASGFSRDDIQVLSPMNKGDYGTVALNIFLQNIFNEHGKPAHRGMRIGDRVIHTKNNYSLLVYNGDVGTICRGADSADRRERAPEETAEFTGIVKKSTLLQGFIAEKQRIQASQSAKSPPAEENPDTDAPDDYAGDDASDDSPSEEATLEALGGKGDHALSVRYPDRDKEVRYPAAFVDQLKLAYAISVHKSQGSEYPAVILVLHDAHTVMLARNLLYTAITRGKKRIYVVGTQSAILKAVRNNRVARRTTLLAERLTGELDT
jgi:ATP-dependent exoDNAse (exonuclease V) alpha subunit